MIVTARAKDFSSDVDCERPSDRAETSGFDDGFCVEVMFLILACSRG